MFVRGLAGMHDCPQGFSSAWSLQLLKLFSISLLVHLDLALDLASTGSTQSSCNPCSSTRQPYNSALAALQQGTRPDHLKGCSLILPWISLYRSLVRPFWTLWTLWQPFQPFCSYSITFIHKNRITAYCKCMMRFNISNEDCNKTRATWQTVASRLPV